jgi:hypothetical protein
MSGIVPPRLHRLIETLVSQTLLEGEVYVDHQGWAHDDEGNRWFVGTGYVGQTLPTTSLPAHVAPGFKSSFKSRSRDTTQSFDLYSTLRKDPENEDLKKLRDVFEETGKLSFAQQSLLDKHRRRLGL